MVTKNGLTPPLQWGGGVAGTNSREGGNVVGTASVPKKYRIVNLG